MDTTTKELVKKSFGKQLKIVALIVTISIGSWLGIDMSQQEKALYDLVSTDNYIIVSGQVLHNYIITGNNSNNL